MLPHIASRLYGTPLLIQRAKLDVILSVLGPRFASRDIDLTPTPEAAAASQRKASKAGKPTDNIRTISIHGTLVNRTLGMDALSGLTSYASIADQMQAALDDPTVDGILLDIDSPGGEVSGCFDLARQIRAASAIKPVWAIAGDGAFSAAYAIASAANRIIITETGGVGSIGVIAMHVDQSAKDEQDGYRYTAITAGAHKADGNPHAPLTDSALATIQAEVDRIYGIFTSLVASHRNMDAKAITDTEAGLYFGQSAVDKGLADSLTSYAGAMVEFAEHLRTRAGTSLPARQATRHRAATTKGTTTMQHPDEINELKDGEGVAALVAEARTAATAAAMQSAQAIAQISMIAGCPERAAEFIAAGKTEAEVRTILLEMRAAQSDAQAIQSTLTQSAPTHNSLLAAIEKLNPKD